eukprot:792555-Prorocentrum_lima.AAC.1
MCIRDRLRRLSWWHGQATQLAEEKRQLTVELAQTRSELQNTRDMYADLEPGAAQASTLSLIHISEPTRLDVI